jgi:hypothetical protein
VALLVAERRYPGRFGGGSCALPAPADASGDGRTARTAPADAPAGGPPAAGSEPSR